MKRHGNLYHRICEYDNIVLAHENARRGKRHYREVKMVDDDPEKYLGQIRDLLVNKTFRNSSYVVFDLEEGGKIRRIAKLPYYPDRIIHHCIMNVLEPIWMRLFVRDTYSSMKGRGGHDGLRRMHEFLKDEAGTTYCLKLDVRKFYPSVDHDILKQIVRRKIKCSDTLGLLDEIIDSAPGLPIGNYLSQYLANLYLTYFDHWVKEVKGMKYYARYCDDIVILNGDKARLHALMDEIHEYFGRELKLTVKPNWQVFPTRVRGIDFLGYRFFGSHTLIRKRIAKAFKTKANRIARLKQATAGDVNGMMSYYGWFVHADGRNLWNKYVPQIFRPIADACMLAGITNPIRRISTCIATAEPFRA
jgi:RNA-directed DNA polymerase